MMQRWILYIHCPSLFRRLPKASKATAETAMGGGFQRNTVFKLKLKKQLYKNHDAKPLYEYEKILCQISALPQSVIYVGKGAG